MTTEKYKYNFSRPSQSGKPGFEPFAQGGFFYFHFNDPDGQPLLFSRACVAAKERDIAMSRVCEIVRYPERYVMKESENGCYISVRTANRRELARTHDFSTREEADRYLRTLLDILPANSEKISTLQNITNNTPSGEAFSVADTFETPRHYFDLKFYPDGHGIIQYPLSQETLCFQGLDEQAIIGFVRKMLMTTLREKNTRAVIFAESESIPVKKEKELSISLPFSTIYGAELDRLRKISVIVNLDNQESEATRSVFFYMKSLKNGQIIHLNKNFGNGPTTVCSNGNAQVVLPILEAGLYRLIATNENKSIPYEVEGCLFQVI